MSETETTRVRIQYADASGYILSGGMYDAEDASEATAWADDFNVVTVSKTYTKRWQITSSDGNIKKSWYDKRFSDIWDALAFISQRNRITFIDADND